MRKNPGKTAEDVTRLLGSLAEDYGLEMPISALCHAVHAMAKKASDRAIALGDDGPEAGDAAHRANFLIGVYDQLRSAYVIAQSGDAED